MLIEANRKVFIVRGALSYMGCFIIRIRITLLFCREINKETHLNRTSDIEVDFIFCQCGISTRCDTVNRYETDARLGKEFLFRWSARTDDLSAKLATVMAGSVCLHARHGPRAVSCSRNRQWISPKNAGDRR